jgi:hypothetical protein
VSSILSRWLIQFCLYLALTSCIPEISSSLLMTSYFSNYTRDVMDWIVLAQDRDIWQALVNAVMNLWVS